MLIDKAEVIFRGGRGGDGSNSFRAHMKGPDGGNGGAGGNVYAVAKNDLNLLNQFSQIKEFSAENGIPGAGNGRTGRNGNDLIIYLPVGTSIIERKSGNLIYDLDKEGEKILLARGGSGGLGNWEFRMEQMIPPHPAESGKKGETKDVVLSLKLIADFGLIGLPNAGKSSLLNELTGAHAKTANYPFTTLSASLGVFEGRVIADIPGLIEGASEGKGLGIGFLKHIEKVKVLLHCISCESADVVKDYKTIRAELGKFNEKLLVKPEIVLLTKRDLVDEKYIKEAFKKLSKSVSDILPVSIHDIDSLEELKKILRL